VTFTPTLPPAPPAARPPLHQEWPPYRRSPRAVLTAVWAIALKDIRVALTERMSLVQAMTLPLNLLITLSLFVLSGSAAPTMVVFQGNEAHEVYAQEFVAAMQGAHSFKITTETQAQANAQMTAGNIVTLVTIPADFGWAVAHHQPVAVPVTINGVDEDMRNDAVRGMRLALNSFYSVASPSQVPVTVDEHDQYPNETGYIPYLALSIIAIALMVAGLLQAGNAAAREFEEQTMRGLLLAPVRPWQVAAGRSVAAFTVSLPAVAVVLAVVIFAVGDRPQQLFPAIGVALLTLAVFAVAGTALGTILKDRSLVATVVRGVPVPLFFLSGVFGPLSWQTAPVQDIGQLMPVHWSIVLIQWYFRGFATSSVPVWGGVLIMAGYLVTFAVVAVLALGRVYRGGGAGARARFRRPGLRRARPVTAPAPGGAAAAGPVGLALLNGPGPLRSPAARWLLAARAIAAKDLRIWLGRPMLIISTLLVPVAYTLVAFLGSAATAASPVAVVNLGGPAGTQIVRAIEDAQVFRLSVVSAARAASMYASGQVAAVVTIPAGTSALLRSGHRAAVQVQIDNINDDMQYDIDRAVPDAVITWYQSAHPDTGRVRVTLAEQSLRGQDVQLYQYSVLPVIVLVITVCGILVAGMSAAEEFERNTVRSLLLAPVPRSVIIAGKTAAGWAFTCAVACLVLGAGAALGWTRPGGASGWAEALAAIVLGSLFAAGLGIAIGTWGQRRQPVSIGATIVSVWLFALAGGLGDIYFEPRWLVNIAAWDPLFYAIHSLQQGVFYGSATGAWRDAAALAVASLLTGVIGTLALRRGLRRS
jgi:ABC-2 type transport system permease protein